jgi:aspartyl aminopeptidase
MERIAIGKGLNREDFFISLANSFILSTDGAHAVHPNYVDKYEKDHKVKLNGGPVIKLNAKQKYASRAENTAFFNKLCEQAGVPSQKYINRADKPCGSTIGPITSTRTGIDAMDVGPPMVSMHSAREMGGIADAHYMIEVMEEFILSPALNSPC